MTSIGPETESDLEKAIGHAGLLRNLPDRQRCIVA